MAYLPKAMNKFVCADFCQGDDRFSFSSRGRQCVTNCITFMMKTLLKDIDDLSTHDMNTILMRGDTLYRKVHTEDQVNGLLHCEELPDFIIYEGNCFTFRKMKPNFGCMSIKGGIDGLGIPLESSINTVFAMSRCKNACIIIFHSAAVAIKYHSQSGRYFVFDSHSRGEDGLCTPDGTAIVSVFQSLQNLCSFLRHLCLSLCATLPLDQVQYELCSFQISCSKKRKRGAIS